MSIISDLINYSRLAFDLRKFLQNSISLEQSKQIITERIHNREKNFIWLIDNIYKNPRNPYNKLLKSAGCEFGDIEQQVNQNGIEPTLQGLLAEGVYMSWEEFKGKKELVRGGNYLHFKQSDLDNPSIPSWYKGQSSGSRSAGTKTKFSLGNRLAQSCYRLPLLEASNALDDPLGIWKEVPPSTNGISHVLDFWILRKPIARWFSTVDESQAQTSLQHRLALRYIIYGSRLWGARLVSPEYVGLRDAYKVARWMADTRKQYGGCSLGSSVSAAVKVCHAAMEHQLDIQGAHFLVGGEPLTAAKRSRIEATGASVTSNYTISEVGRIGIGCLGTGATDDVHLLTDSIAMIQHWREVDHTDAKVNSFLFTPLLPSAPKLLLNFESDDYGTVETCSCGCVFEQLGFDKHLRNIRSFAKLTGNGVSIIGSDFDRILEEVLPRKYGGTATDYQLLEEEDNRGQTRLSLIISPSVGTVDDNEVISTVLSEFSKVESYGGMTASLWSQAEALRVRRMYPIQRRGKIMTLEIAKAGKPHHT